MTLAPGCSDGAPPAAAAPRDAWPDAATLDRAIADTHAASLGRTRYQGQKPFRDEVLLAALLAERALRATPSPQQPDAGEVMRVLRQCVDSFDKLITECGEGGRRGRAIDLIPRAAWNRAITALAAARALTGEDRSNG